MADLKEQIKNQNRHPWELCRANEILKTLKKICIEGKKYKIADIGAGDLFFDEFILSNLNNIEIDAVDTEFKTLITDNPKITKKRKISDLPSNKYDIIIMMDVLEHIDDNDEFLREVESKLKRKKDSFLIVTVPAHQKLYSNHDKFLGHYRRYNKKTLAPILKKSKFSVLELRYFFLSLFFARSIIRLFESAEKGSETQEGISNWGYSQYHPITLTILMILSIDLWFGRIISFLHLPWNGLSLLAVCQRKIT